MTDLLLDTHIWIWVSTEHNKSISRNGKSALSSANQKWISAISAWELAKLIEKKRIGRTKKERTEQMVSEYRCPKTHMYYQIPGDR